MRRRVGRWESETSRRRRETAAEGDEANFVVGCVFIGTNEDSDMIRWDSCGNKVSFYDSSNFLISFKFQVPRFQTYYEPTGIQSK